MLEILEHGDAVLRGFPSREWPDRHALFFASGVFLELRLEPGEQTTIEGMTWYEPEMVRQVAETMLQETVPDDCLRPLSELPKAVQDDALELYRLASGLRERLADGTRWVKGTRWTEPFVMKGSVDWLALEVHRRKLTGLAHWDETDVRSELCQVMLRDRAAQASPGDSRLRKRALELDARATSELDALDDLAMGFVVNEGHGFERICVRRGDGFARLHLLDGKLYELDWWSAEGVRHEILRALVSNSGGRLIGLGQELLDSIAVKTDRSQYPRLMRAGKLKVGAVPAQTDSEWTLYFSKGKFRIRYSMDGRSSPVSEREALGILSRRGYSFVVFEGRGDHD